MSSDESIAEPYPASDDDDVWLPPDEVRVRASPVENYDLIITEDENGNDEEKAKPMKRRSDPKKWERENKKSKLRKSRIQSEMPECRCKCKTKFTGISYKQVCERFQNLSNHNEQNLYLRGCISSKPAARHSNKNKPPRKVFQYTVVDNNKSVTICQNFFLAMHAVTRDRLRKKILKFDIDDVRDFRGKHHNRKNKLPTDTVEKVNSFLKNLPAVESHYSRSQNMCKKYLQSDLTVSQLHKNYGQCFPDNPVKYGMFHKIFVENFNYSFAHPRKDICATCTKFMADLNSAKLRNNENEIMSLSTARELHLRRSQVFFTLLKEKKENASNKELAICFDFQKNLPLPVTNIGDEYYKRQLWLHNFGINNIVSNQATMFLFTENFATKGPNEVITALNYYIKKYKTDEQEKLSIFCDNCFSQNKNRYLFTYLDSLCASGIFRGIVVYYPIPGHSMMPVDRCFALIEKKRVKREKVDNPDYYIQLIQNARCKDPFEVVFLEQSLLTKSSKITGNFATLKVLDYKKLYGDKIKSSLPGISKCRSVIFSAADKPRLREAMTGDYGSCFNLYKVGYQRLLSNIIPSFAYDKFLKLKEEKLANIKFLVHYIEAEENREFYKVLDEESVKLGREEDQESDVEQFE